MAAAHGCVGPLPKCVTSKFDLFETLLYEPLTARAVRQYDVTGFFYGDMGCDDKEGYHWLLGEEIRDQI